VKAQTRNVLLIVLAVAVLFVLLDSMFIVTETNQVIVTQFGEPRGGAVTKPGIHFKTPFIQKTNFFEKRWLEWDSDPTQIPTRDKKYIWVETYCRWRISDPLVYFQRVGDERNAQSRLDDIVDGVTRNIIAKYDLIEIVRSSNRTFEISEDASILDISEVTMKIQTGREQLSHIILVEVDKITPQFGVEIRDVRIKRVNYVDEVQRKVFDRMIAERQRIASKYRSEGDGKSAEVRGQKERELKKIQSEAYRKSQEIKGKADAEATRVYAQAYNLDPEFYQFMKSLDSYRTSLTKDTWIFLSTDSEFLKYLKDSGIR
jgi:membrane protease subunit HflC